MRTKSDPDAAAIIAGLLYAVFVIVLNVLWFVAAVWLAVWVLRQMGVIV